MIEAGSTRGLNVSIKNADFVTKKEKGYARSDILMTKELLTRETWDTAAIDDRQRELSNWVFGIWKFPGEAAPVPVEAAKEEIAVEPVEADLEQLPEVPGVKKRHDEFG